MAFLGKKFCPNKTTKNMFLVENVPALAEVLGYESEVLTFGLRKWDFHIP